MRLKCTFVESKKAMLRRLNEIRSVWIFPPDALSQPVYSPRPIKEGSINLDLEESMSTSDPPVGTAMPVGEETSLDAGGASRSIPPIKTAFPKGYIRKSTSVAEASGYTASTSTDIGLRFLLEAITERGERIQYMDTQVFCEATVSMDLTLGHTPSFLDDICKHF